MGITLNVHKLIIVLFQYFISLVFKMRQPLGIDQNGHVSLSETPLERSMMCWPFPALQNKRK